MRRGDAGQSAGESPADDARTFGALPLPAWGEGRSEGVTDRRKALAPHPTPLPRKSGLPDLREIKTRPGQARGAWEREQTEFAAPSIANLDSNKSLPGP